MMGSGNKNPKDMAFQISLIYTKEGAKIICDEIIEECKLGIEDEWLHYRAEGEDTCVYWLEVKNKI